VNKRGRVGVVIPTGIATDATNQHFFRHLVETGRLVSLYDFENREKLFPAVDSRYKFSLLTLSGKPVERSEFAFFLTRAEQLRDEQRRFTLSPEDFALLNPNTRTCPIFRTRQDAELTKAIYKRIPVLVNEQTGENPWNVRFLAMFHMANDSHLFRTRQELEAEGYALVGNRFIRGDKVCLPLYEAKMIWHYDHRFGTYEGVDSRSSTQLPTPDERQHTDPNFLIQPWYWVPEEEVLFRSAHLPPIFIDAMRSGSQDFILLLVAWLLFACWLYIEAWDGNESERSNPEAAMQSLLPAWIEFANYHTFARSIAPTSLGLCADEGVLAPKPVGLNYLPSASLNEIAKLERVRGQGLLLWHPAELKKVVAFLELPKRYPILFQFAMQQPNLAERFPPDWRHNIMPPLQNEEQALNFARELLREATPKWLLGFRDVTNATNERTAIFSLLPKVGVGHTMPVMFVNVPDYYSLCLLGNFTAICLDYAVRQKLGGMHLSYNYLQQLPILPPYAYTAEDLRFIVPRVLELVYTSWDIKPFADDFWRSATPELKEAIFRQWEENRQATGGNSFDLPEWASAYPEITPANPAILQSPSIIQHSSHCPFPPFKWDEERRARLRAELDAYYARLYGLTRKQLRYILDPADLTEKELADILDPWEEVDDPLEPTGYEERCRKSTFPGETFRVLKEKEIRQFGEYRTRRLILEAWEKLTREDMV
jgi:hypothetical protein